MGQRWKDNFDEEYQIHDWDAIGLGEKIKPILFLQLEKTWCSDAERATKQEGGMHHTMYCHVPHHVLPCTTVYIRPCMYGAVFMWTMYCVQCFFPPTNNLIQMFYWLSSTKYKLTTERWLCQILHCHVQMYNATQSGPNIFKKRSFDKVWTKDWHICIQAPSDLDLAGDFEVKTSRKSLKLKNEWGSAAAAGCCPFKRIPHQNIKPWTWCFKFSNRLQSIETVSKLWSALNRPAFVIP